MTGTLKTPYVTIGRALRKDWKKLIAQLRHAGCTVTWDDLDEGFWDSTYYSFKVEGPDAQIHALISIFREYGIGVTIV